MKTCSQCGKGSEEGATFGTLVKGNREDSLCVKCRFSEIDSKYSRPEDIRRDMRKADIPVNGNGKKLR